ncbi:MAG: LysM peptidoglycan-binding domain-containing protein [Mariprofundus sp.]|nr:LysM peptidoglycan-binding domain-containing protein [Mariprofundus sp.]
MIKKPILYATYKSMMLTLMIGLFCLSPALLHAATLHTDAADNKTMKADISKAYVVKKGDTLWDIANHFFKDPHKWLKVWERNMHITNPDLIYPGNKIWFDGKNIRQGGLSLVKPTPQVIIKPVERLEAITDNSIMLTALERQDFIQPDQVQGVGHVLDSKDDRLNFGANDHVYLKMDHATNAGSLFDVFRTADVITDPNSGEAAGVLVEHLGQIRITSGDNGIYRGLVIKAFEEISRGDRLKPAREINQHITPSYADQRLTGSIMYIRNNAREAAQNQVVGISLGINNGIKAGMLMSVYKSGRLVNNKVDGGVALLPTEKVGELLVLVPQQRASIALITKSTAPVNIADAVQTIIEP